MTIDDIVTTDELVAMVKHTLDPYGMVHVSQVLAWINKQADITRTECMEAVWCNAQLDKEVEEVWL